MQIKKKGQEGFTLIELLVVVVIIGILASVAVPNFMGAQDKAKNSGVQANGHNVQMSLEQYAVDNSGSYPADLGSVIGAATGYMSAYPKTPWNTQQAGHVTATMSVALNQPTAGNGSAVTPTTWTHYGSVHFIRSGTANEGYDISAAGKRGDKALNVLWVKNY